MSAFCNILVITQTNYVATLEQCNRHSVIFLAVWLFLIKQMSTVTKFRRGKKQKLSSMRKLYNDSFLEWQIGYAVQHLRVQNDREMCIMPIIFNWKDQNSWEVKICKYLFNLFILSPLIQNAYPVWRSQC